MDSACLNPENQTIIVAVGGRLQLRWESEGLYPCAEDPCTTNEKIRLVDGNRCEISFNRDTDDMDSTDFSSCENSRDESWRATTKNPPNVDDVYLLIESAHPDDRYENL